MTTHPEFLSLEVVLQLHADSLSRFGGLDGVRDKNQIESALGAAESAWMYGRTIFDVAATYAFHIAEAQAFFDGNKRTAVAAALTFLRGCGCPAFVDDGRLYKAMIDIANRQLDKAGLAELLRTMCSEQQ